MRTGKVLLSLAMHLLISFIIPSELVLPKVLLFADSISKLFVWISAEVRSCALQSIFLSTKSAVGFWSHYALEVVEKVVLTVTVYLASCAF